MRADFESYLLLIQSARMISNKIGIFKFAATWEYITFKTISIRPVLFNQKIFEYINAPLKIGETKKLSSNKISTSRQLRKIKLQVNMKLCRHFKQRAFFHSLSSMALIYLKPAIFSYFYFSRTVPKQSFQHLMNIHISIQRRLFLKLHLVERYESKQITPWTQFFVNQLKVVVENIDACRCNVR